MDAMQIYKSIITVSLLFLFEACSNSGLTMEQKNRLVISNDETFIRVKTPYVETKRINLGPLYVDQYIIASDDTRCVVYEDIRTAGGYRFNYAYKRSVDLIFNAASVDELKRYGDLTLYRLTLRDENSSKLNLLALTTSKKSLKLLYGFDDDESVALEKSLDKNNTVLYYELSSSTDKRDHCIKSGWQPKVQILDNLVGREGGGTPRIGK